MNHMALPPEEFPPKDLADQHLRNLNCSPVSLTGNTNGPIRCVPIISTQTLMDKRCWKRL
jgi:hypothetical protein